MNIDKLRERVKMANKIQGDADLENEVAIKLINDLLTEAERLDAGWHKANIDLLVAREALRIISNNSEGIIPSPIGVVNVSTYASETLKQIGEDDEHGDRHEP